MNEILHLFREKEKQKVIFFFVLTLTTISSTKLNIYVNTKEQNKMVG